jgi:ferredoxin-type protein NapG
MADEQGRHEFIKETFGSFFSTFKEFKAAASIGSKEAEVKKKPFRPPGAIEESAFLKACTRCDECIKACPENAIMKIIQPNSIAHLTPIINFRESPCRLCHDLPCAKSCATGALIKVELISEVKIGIAKINGTSCYAWLGQDCEYCINSCPLTGEAILKDNDGRPVINESKCAGCGVCENICPVRIPAITIFNHVYSNLSNL